MSSLNEFKNLECLVFLPSVTVQPIDSTVTEVVPGTQLIEFTKKEMGRAFAIWSRNYQMMDVDRSLEPFLNLDVACFQPGQASWLKNCRKSLFLSANSVAEKLEISRATYVSYEAGEVRGSITLAKLAEAAAAMDCELVYAIRPKDKKFFSHKIWEQLLPTARNHPWMKKCDPRRKGEAVAAMARNFMKDTAFRKKQGWSQRANSEL